MATSTSGHAALLSAICVLFISLAASADNDDHGSAKNVYDAEMFQTAIETKPHFIMFFAPWYVKLNKNFKKSQ